MMMALGLFISFRAGVAEAQLMDVAPDEAYELQSPEEFLGYEMGKGLTPHHRVVDYVRHVAEFSERVKLQQYGQTYGGRPLLLAFISSEENVGRLEEIRLNNLVRAGLRDEPETELESKAIVWLSYNVHGNEISATEAALFTLYELADSQNLRSESYLENTVVIIDPLLNPDGRERYVNWYTQTAGQQPDPYPTAREHIEEWPSGRSNHYNFDLNRDWAWQTQLETRQRMIAYHDWMPHIHADFHEMGINSPYYFAPAAEPFHEAITEWQREFQTTIGENHMQYFDENYRTYFTREIFDLYYPSYGDTYPTYNGAIGMTYEQAGNSQGGLSVITAEGDTLTFERRVLNQHIVGMSTVEVTAEHYERVAEEFYRFFERSAEQSYAGFNTYVISGENHPDKMQHLASYLDAWDIRYGHAPERRSERAFDYQSQENRDISLSENDLLISARQPKSVLLNVLFEPQSTIIDSLTYDLTAWSVPYAMGLEAYALERELRPEEQGNWRPERPETPPAQEQDIVAPYAYLAEWRGKQDAYFLSQLLQEDIRVRIASEPFSMDGEKTWERGTLIITRRGNEPLGEEFDRIIRSTARALDRHITPVETGFVQTGQDFGSGGVRALDAPRVGLIGGRGA
ncbi:MAG: M14 family metallopeptidase, partial [Cyclonatronaceae bacterium]